MANLRVIDADGTTVEIKATGVGSAGDPFIVQRLTLLGAGTAAIGKLAANSGVDIGDVDITSIAAGDNNIGNVDIVTLPALIAGTAIIGKVGIDQTTPGTTDSVTLKATEAHLGEIGGNLSMISTEFTRPSNATAYAVGDAVSNDATTTTMQALANAARVSGGSGYITGIRITTDLKSITPRFRIHFWNTNGATVAGDNLAFKSVYADNSKRVGYWDLPAMITPVDTSNSDMSWSIDMTVRIPYTCAATSLYYTLETLDVFTPASAEKVLVTVFVDRN